MSFRTFLSGVVAFISGGVCAGFSYIGDQSAPHAIVIGSIVGVTTGIISRIVLASIKI